MVAKGPLSFSRRGEAIAGLLFFYGPLLLVTGYRPELFHKQEKVVQEEEEMNTRKEAEKQLVLLERGAEDLIPRDELLVKLEKSLETGVPLRVKLGIDPTAEHIHLGHMVVYGKLRQFQDLGHQAVLIIGDYTASIGDPTGRNTERPPLSLAQVRENASRYTEQIFRLVNKRRSEVRWQSEWYGSLSLVEVLQLAGSFTLAQIFAHETFRLRHEKGIRVGLHELFYPLLQAYDSLAVQADVEIGGTDQKFNILSGRDLQRDRGFAPQCAVLMPLLPGLDGRKMSKSFGNDIPVTAEAGEQFARLMAMSDESMNAYQRLVLLDSPELCASTAARIAAGENPMRIKQELSQRIVSRFNGEGEAEKVRKQWERTFSRREAPADMPEFLCPGTMEICRLLKESGLTVSMSEARRLVAEGAVYSDESRITDPYHVVDAPKDVSTSRVIRIGRRRYVRVRFSGAP